MVAMELAASCRPLRKSKASATAIRAIRTGRLSARSIGASQVVGDDAVDLVRDVLEAIDDFLKMIVEIGLDDEIHGAVRVAFQALEIERLAALVVDLVGAFLGADDFLGERIEPVG